MMPQDASYPVAFRLEEAILNLDIPAHEIISF